jgi:hypothetical protein
MRTPSRAAVLAASLFLSACGPRRLAVIAPVADPETAAMELRSRTELEEPLQIVFSWNLNEAGRRLNGRGVARVEPPYKARLDLFLHNNETVLRASLVDGELRLPPESADDILPPADLMWGVLGVFLPPAGTELLGAEQLEGGAMRLRYAYPNGTELHYEVVEGFVRTLEMLERGRVVQRVRLEPLDDDRYPVEAVYRNMADFRELTLERESLRVVAPFDSEIWDPRS